MKKNAHKFLIVFFTFVLLFVSGFSSKELLNNNTKSSNTVYVYKLKDKNITLDSTGADRPLNGFTTTSSGATSQIKQRVCTSIEDVINDLWNLILIVAPILVILMGSIGFVKALTSQDSDALKKETSNFIKRTLALLLLLMLKVIINTVLNLFGLASCF